MSIPPPPAADLLSDFPVHEISATQDEDVLCRIVRRYDELGRPRTPLFFSSSGLGRFDSAPGPTDYGACYFAREEIAAFIERFAAYRIILQDVIEAHELIRVAPERSLRLADLCSPLVLGKYGLTREICTVAPDYGPPQRGSAALRAAGFDGIWYGPRHDPRGDLRAAALFGPSGGREPDEIGLRVISRGPVPHEVVVLAAQEFALYVVAGEPG